MPTTTEIRPGVYSTIVSAGPGEVPNPAPLGSVGTPIRAHWGPLGVAVEVTGVAEVETLYGTGLGTEVPKNAIRGGAASAFVYRVGTGGVKATDNLDDSAALAVLQIDAKHPGDVDLGYIVRDDPADIAGKGQLLLYVDGLQREVWGFAKGTNEIDTLLAGMAVSGTDDATHATGSRLVDVTKLAPGSGTLARVPTMAPLSGGTDPTVANGDYTTAFAAMEGVDVGAVVSDSETPAVHAALRTQVAQWVAASRFIFGFVGEPTSVALATRATNARALNHEAMAYVGSDGYDAGDILHDGAEAAAINAGQFVGGDLSQSLTWKPVPSINRLGEVLSPSQIETAILSGMLVWSRSEQSRTPQVESGINTLTTLSGAQDAGWKKLKRSRVRYEAIRLARLSVVPMIGNAPNDEPGRDMLISRINHGMNPLIADRLLLSAVATIMSWSGDQVRVRLELADIDSIERVYLNISFAA